jgi:hypothetical protein
VGALILCCSGKALQDAPLALKLARNMVRSGEDSAVEPQKRQRKTNSSNRGKKKKKREKSHYVFVCLFVCVCLRAHVCVCVNLYSGAL